MPQLRFEGHLESDQGACFIRLPAEVLAALGRDKRVPVKVTINGYTYRTTVAVYGGKYCLGVPREIRDAAGVAAGEQPLHAPEGVRRMGDRGETVRDRGEADQTGDGELRARPGRR